MVNCLTVGAGGFLGAVLRYLIGLIPIEAHSGFPVKTFAVNIIGCFAIGLFAGIAEKNALDQRLVLLLKVGVCGGFTTFSSFALETQGLLTANHAFTAVLYALGSLVLGTLAVILGQMLVK